MNQQVQRHNALRNALRDEGVSCRKEVTLANGRRLADLGLLNFDSRGPTVVDLVVNHPSAPSASRDRADARLSLKQAEESKICNSEALCATQGWLFSLMGGIHGVVWDQEGPQFCRE